MPKINSCEKIVVGIDAVKKYAKISSSYHGEKAAVCIEKKVFFHLSGETKSETDIWCDHCVGQFYYTLPSFLKAHGIED